MFKTCERRPDAVRAQWTTIVVVTLALGIGPHGAFRP